MNVAQKASHESTKITKITKKNKTVERTGVWALRFERRIDGLAPLRGAGEATDCSRIFWLCVSAVV